ncbi:MAG: restriction endonuclease subunit R [Cyanobacteriota bacterium]|nr:restriction endonuclease subunit R [Cyanobacteriota bacterium]
MGKLELPSLALKASHFSLAQDPFLQMSLSTNASLQDFQQVYDDPFFSTELAETPQLAGTEKQRLERARVQYFDLGSSSAIADLVPLVLLSPLLDLAGFYGAPFSFSARDSILLPGSDEETPSGKINMLVIQEQLWIATVESQWATVTPQTALPLVLETMMDRALDDGARFALITNGMESLFVRLIGAETPQYALSETYSLSGLGFELYEILRLLKAIARIVSASEF